MKASILFTILPTMAFSLGTSLVSSSSPLEKRAQEIINQFDEPGIRNRVLQCGKATFTKPHAYSTLYQAKISTVTRNTIKWCKSLRECKTYPGPFISDAIKFRVPGPYRSYPIEPDDKSYVKGRPINYVLVYNDANIVAGVVMNGLWGPSKCLYNDQIIPLGRPIGTRIRNSIGGYLKNPFARNKQQGTASAEPVEAEPEFLTRMRNRIGGHLKNPYASNKQQGTASAEPVEAEPEDLTSMRNRIGRVEDFSFVSNR